MIVTFGLVCVLFGLIIYKISMMDNTLCLTISIIAAAALLALVLRASGVLAERVHRCRETRSHPFTLILDVSNRYSASICCSTQDVEYLKGAAAGVTGGDFDIVSRGTYEEIA